MCGVHSLVARMRERGCGGEVALGWAASAGPVRGPCGEVWWCGSWTGVVCGFSRTGWPAGVGTGWAEVGPVLGRVG
jgi:hypothetical protein